MIGSSRWWIRMSGPPFTGTAAHRHARIRASLAVTACVLATAACGESEQSPITPTPTPPDSNLEVGEGVWSPFPSLKVPIGRFAAAAYRGTIFIAGGTARSAELPGDTPVGSQDAVYRFNWERNAWDSLNAFPARLRDHHMVVLSDSLFVVGGQYDGSANYSRSLWAYDPDLDVWERRPGMPAERAGAAAAAVGGRLLVVGGADASDGDMLVYDPAAGVWTREPGPDVRFEPGLADAGGVLFAFGGRRSVDRGADPDTEIHAFDRSIGSWSIVAALPKPIHAPAVAVLDGRVHFLGGERGYYQRQDYHLAWEPATERWFEYGRLPMARMFSQAVVLDGTVYWIGGLERTEWSDAVYMFTPG